jgi:hypothetical protein
VVVVVVMLLIKPFTIEVETPCYGLHGNLFGCGCCQQVEVFILVGMQSPMSNILFHTRYLCHFDASTLMIHDTPSHPASPPRTFATTKVPIWRLLLSVS